MRLYCISKLGIALSICIWKALLKSNKSPIIPIKWKMNYKTVFWLGNLIYSKLPSVSPYSVDDNIFLVRVILHTFDTLLLCLQQGRKAHQPKYCLVFFFSFLTFIIVFFRLKSWLPLAVLPLHCCSPLLHTYPSVSCKLLTSLKIIHPLLKYVRLCNWEINICLLQ